MASQRAVRIERSSVIVGESPPKVRAVIELACGCVVERVLASDRILETMDGLRIAVGKYPCPVGHPLAKR